jgi:hypothetical protein
MVPIGRYGFRARELKLASRSDENEPSEIIALGYFYRDRAQEILLADVHAAVA